MEKFEVNILGCGSALPTLRHSASCQVVNVREKLFMIDCGEGAQVQFRKQKLNFGKLHAIFISHIHGDHCFGLIGLISTLSLLGRTADLHIYAEPALEKGLRPQIDVFCCGIEFQVVFHAIDTTKRCTVYEDRSVSVSTIPLKHRVPCCGFLFEETAPLPHIRRDMIDYYGIPNCYIKNIKLGADYILPDGTLIENARLVTPAAKARSYAYCADTCFDPKVAGMVKGVDLLYHEATFATSELARARQTLHTTAHQAATIAQSAGAKRLLIGHYSARYDEKFLLEEAIEVFPETMLSNEGLCIEV